MESSLLKYLISVMCVLLAASSACLSAPSDRRLVEAGQNQYTEKNYRGAIETLTKAIEACPTDADAYRFRAASFMETNQFDKALQDYSTAIKLAPQNPNPYVSIAWIYLKMGDYEKAIESTSKAIALNSSLSMAYKYRADARNNLKQYNEAIDDYTSALKRDANLLDALRNRALVYLNAGNFQGVLEDMNRAIGIIEPEIAPATDGTLPRHPGAAEYFHIRGYAYYRLGQLNEANLDEHKARLLGFVPAK